LNTLEVPSEYSRRSAYLYEIENNLKEIKMIRAKHIVKQKQAGKFKNTDQNVKSSIEGQMM